MFEYDRLVERVYREGEWMDRRGTRCLTLRNAILEFGAESVPLVVRRRIDWKPILGEYRWILAGLTDNKTLVEEFGCNYWTPWTQDEEFYRRTGVPTGFFGPIYGFQLRHYGADYLDSGGIDQWERLIEGLRTDPYSRRHVVVLWNPAQIHLMRLPPCHLYWHLSVDGLGLVWMKVLMRSCDVMVGLPANIFGYYFVLRRICDLVGRDMGGLVMDLDDVHIYEDQIGSAEDYLKLPLVSNDLVLNERYELEGWNPGPRMKIPVWV